MVHVVCMYVLCVGGVYTRCSLVDVSCICLLVIVVLMHNITRKMIIIMRGEPSLMARSGVTVLNI